MQSTILILSEKRQTKFGQNLVKKYESKNFLKKFSKDYCQKFWTEKNLLDKISQNLHTFLTSHLPYSQAPLQVCLALSPTQMNIRWLKRLGLRTVFNSSQVTSCDGCRKFFDDYFNYQMLSVLKRDLAYSQVPFQARLPLPPTRLDLRWLKRLGLRMVFDFVQIRPEWRILASKSSGPPKWAATLRWAFPT